MLSHNNLSNYYFLIHNLCVVQNKYTVTEVEAMIPWERDIYTGLITLMLERETKE